MLEPIDLRAELGPDPDVGDAYRLVTERMQDTLGELSDERTLPIVG